MPDHVWNHKDSYPPLSNRIPVFIDGFLLNVFHDDWVMLDRFNSRFCSSDLFQFDIFPIHGADGVLDCDADVI